MAEYAVIDHQDRIGQLLEAPLGLAVLERLAQIPPAFRAGLDLDRLVIEARIDLSRYAVDYEQRVAALVDLKARLLPLAAWLVESADRWWQGLDRNNQVWVGAAGTPLDQERVQVDLSQFSLDIPKPRRAFWTSTVAPHAAPPWAYWLRFGEDRQEGPLQAWRLKVSDRARIAEIHGPGSWRSFVSTYPAAPQGQSLTPDWAKVAADWDAVHLSVGGLLTAEDVAQTDQIAELQGWSMESTAWFRWSFISIEEIQPHEDTLRRR